MKSLFPGLSLLACFFILHLTGCATAPGGEASKSAGDVPDWVLNPPEGDDQFMYFTSSGSSESKDIAKAEEIARGALIDEIMRFLGVRITSETTATAKASLDSFQTEMIQQLTSTSSGRVTGLEISDKWADQREGSAIIYLLARYNRKDLLKEKKRLEEIFQEKIEAVAGPEREARELESRGMHYQAALRFMEAAAAAYKSDIENIEIKFERNINSAKEAIRRISLIKVKDNLSVNVGEEFSEPFRLKVVDGSTLEDRGVPGVAVRVVFKEIKSSGRKAVRSRLLKTDAQGMAAFNHPTLEFVGKEEVAMSLDMSEALEPLQDVPKNLIGQVDGLEELILKKKVRFSFESISSARKIPTGIAIFNLDASGNPISSTDTASGVLERMTGAGFQVETLPVSVTGVAGRSDSQVITLLQKHFKGQVERAVYGTARITDHDQDGSFVIIQVTGSIRVADLEKGTILLTINKSKRAQGTNASAALSAAFNKLGEDIGEAIINQLR